MSRFNDESPFGCIGRDETVENMVHLATEAASFVQVANDLFGGSAISGVLKFLYFGLDLFGQLS